MFAVYLKFIKERFLSLAIYTGSMIAFLELYVLTFPSLASQTQQLSQVVKSMPKGLLESFGVDPSSLTLFTLEGLLSTKHFSFVWPLVTVMLAVSLANHALSGEVEDGTMALTISQPISRFKLFLSRYLAGLTVLALFVAATILAVFPLAELHNITYIVNNNYVLLWSGMAFSVAVFSVAFLCSALFSTKGRASLVASGIFLTMYVASVFSTLKDSVKNIRYGSFFYYFNSGAHEIRGEYIKWEFPVFLGAALVLFFVGSVWFNRRDIQV